MTTKLQASKLKSVAVSNGPLIMASFPIAGVEIALLASLQSIPFHVTAPASVIFTAVVAEKQVLVFSLI